MKLNKKLIALVIAAMSLSTSVAPTFAAGGCGNWEAYNTSNSCVRNPWSEAKNQKIGDWITKIFYKRQCVDDRNRSYWETKTEEKRKDNSCTLD